MGIPPHPNARTSLSLASFGSHPHTPTSLSLACFGSPPFFIVTHGQGLAGSTEHSRGWRAAAALSSLAQQLGSKPAGAWWNGGADLLESWVHPLLFCLHLSALLGNEETPHFTEAQQTGNKMMKEKPGLFCTNSNGLEPT